MISTSPVSTSPVSTQGGVVQVFVAEGALLQTGTAAVRKNSLVEAAALDSALSAAKTGALVEIAVLDSASAQLVARYPVIAEDAVLASVATPTQRFVAALEETAILDDAVVQPRPSTTVTEVAALDAAAVPRSTLRQDQTEAARVTGFAVLPIITVVVEAAGLDDATTPTKRVLVGEIETALLASAIASRKMFAASVAEDARLDSAALPRQLLLGFVTEVAWIEGMAVLPATSDAARVWTANVRTWAMSWYSGLDFNGMGNTFATSGQGVYTKGAAAVSASFTTGASMMKSTKKKKPYDVYCAGTHNRPMTVQVTGDVDGSKVTSSYTQMARNALSDRVVRTKIGRGFNSTYLQFKHSSDGPFVARMIEVNFDESARRI